jgi:histidinol-phosphate aminotransferase
MPPFPVNLAALVAAEAAVGDRGALRRYVRNIQATRSWFARELGNLGVKTFPSAGNFLLADFGPRGPRLFRRLQRGGILVRDRSGDIGVGMARITIGTQVEMNLLVKKIKESEFSADRRR